MKKTTIPTIIGIVVLVLGVAAGVFLLGQQQLFRLGASPDSIPKDVRISNISDSGFTVTWTTDKETLGFLNYGTDSTLDKVAHPSSTTPSSTHLVTIRNLEAGETYFFKLNSDSQKYDNNGIPWQTTTGGTLNPPTNSISPSAKLWILSVPTASMEFWVGSICIIPIFSPPVIVVSASSVFPRTVKSVVVIVSTVISV